MGRLRLWRRQPKVPATAKGSRPVWVTVEAIVQNQDNREHDLLDSDDYYQFEGGAAGGSCRPFRAGIVRSITTTTRARNAQ